MPINLPPEIEIPHPFKSTQMNIDEWQPARVQVTNNGRRYKTEIETPEGTRTIQNPDCRELIEALTSSPLTFCMTTPGEFDSLLKYMGDKYLFALNMGLSVETLEWDLTYRGSVITILKGRTRHKIINLFRFFNFPDEIPPKELFVIEAYVGLLVQSLRDNNISFSDLSSPVSVSRHLLKEAAWWEFPCRQMDFQTVSDFYQSCHGARQESVGIGRIDVNNYDMRTAHLNIMSQLPSIRGCNYFKDAPLIPETSYGSYLIQARIPSMILCPLPVQLAGWEFDVIYPHGEITGWYAKPYLDLLDRMGLHYRIIKSHQYVPVDAPDFPFEKVTQTVRNFMANAPDLINGKAFYYGMAGSTIAWRWEVLDAESGEFYPRAYPVFNPMIYGHVLAIQNTRTFLEAGKAGPIAIRSDAVTTRTPLRSTFRHEDSGSMLFTTPMFKTFPSGKGEIWEQRVKDNRDYTQFSYNISAFPTIHSHLNNPRASKLGRMVEREIIVHPNHGKRVGFLPPRVGALLDGWYPSAALNIDVVRSSKRLEEVKG